MNKKENLDGVKDTLYIPLVSRIYVSEKFPHFFYDEKALSLKVHIPKNTIKNNIMEYFYMGSVCRQRIIDSKIQKFIEKNRNCNIVFLGAGLETAYDRIGNKTVNFYEMDLPEVIEIRRRVLGNGENEKLISGDMFNLNWIKEIDTSLPTLISVAGVYPYFKEAKIIEMIKKMKVLLPKGELIFDATDSKGLKIANQYVKKTGNKNAKMYFSIDDPQIFAEKTDTKILEVSGFYNQALKECKGLKLITRIFMYFSDKWKRTMIIHLSLTEN